MNQLVLVGRLVEIKESKTENGESNAIITLAVTQPFKNIDGTYDTNFIECILFGPIATNTMEYCKKGDVIGVKGRVQRIDREKPAEIIAEKVIFLSSKKENE